MIITLVKFGDILADRSAGKEAWAAFQPTLRVVGSGVPLTVDFSGVKALGPSWADEFLTPLKAQFGDRVVLTGVTNPSVKHTISFLEKVHGISFS